MINLPAMALRRRSEELFASAEREKLHNPDSAALLIFYAAECGLKAAYMLQNNLKYTDEARGSAKCARSFSHNIVALIQALNISRASMKPVPAVVTVRLGLNGTPAVLHEAWRYGEKIQDTNVIYDNVMAGVRLARAYLPKMAEKQWGRFLLLGSESAFNIPADMIHYGVSKTADVALARGLAKRMAGTGVTVNSVLPGPTLSEGVEAMLETERARSGKPIEDVAAAFVQENRSTSIIQRAATVEEVANMVVYLASPLASATTGAALRVDGGVLDTLM